ncbi:MAG TPA: sigma-70 family RNA polymerase sigma factor [Ktedonobacteraceae bacterium]
MWPSEYEGEQQSLEWLAEIYRAYAGELQRYIYSKVGEHTLAEDLTSTVFLKALRWLRTGQGTEGARGWLYATARTTIADHWQALGQYEAQPLSELETRFAFQVGSDEQAGQQAALRVQRLLSLLPERERNVLMLRYLRGYSAAEIAEALGTNAGHIRVLQLRALRRAAQLESQERKEFAMQEEQESPFDACVRQLSTESRRALDLARDEAITLNHNFIGTEHLLWGLLTEGSLTSFFAPLGIVAERIHSGIVFIFERMTQAQQGQSAYQGAPAADADALKLLTPRARQVVVLAGEEIKRLGVPEIRPEHLLLGIMNEGEGIGAGLLRSLSVSLVQARAALVPAESGQICSFCGRSGSQIKRIFPAERGPGAATTSDALICDRCVERFHSLLHQA